MGPVESILWSGRMGPTGRLNESTNVNINAPGKDLSNAKGDDRVLCQDTTLDGDNGILLEGSTDKIAEKKPILQRSLWNTPENKTKRADCKDHLKKINKSSYCYYCSYHSGKNNYGVYYSKVTSSKRTTNYCTKCDVNLCFRAHTWKESCSTLWHKGENMALRKINLNTDSSSKSNTQPVVGSMKSQILQTQGGAGTMHDIPIVPSIFPSVNVTGKNLVQGMPKMEHSAACQFLNLTYKQVSNIIAMSNRENNTKTSQSTELEALQKKYDEIVKKNNKTEQENKDLKKK